MLTLRWRAPSGVFGQMIKVSCERGSPLELHDHDYPEVFWIEEGPCLHLINGAREVLSPGDLMFIRARDRHQFVCVGRRRFTMSNLECHPTIVAGLRRRHPQPFADWFDDKAAMPRKWRLGEAALHRMTRMGLDFATGQPDALHLESFLLDLAKLLMAPHPALKEMAGAPDWLRQALLKAEEPEVFSQGVPGLVRVAERSAEHVTRTCVKHLGQTPTRIVETLRMRWAERQLRLTTDPVTDVALACGYATTAPFYRAFRRHYGRTPFRYRRWLGGG